MTDPETLRMLYGTTIQPAEARRFSVGRLSFEMLGGDLRTIHFDGVEVVRGIQYLVRDRDWGTLSPEIRDLHVEDAGGASTIVYAADCMGPDGDRLSYRVRIHATERSLDFTVDAEAMDDVTTNRLGFCVLHPAGLAGAPLQIEHGDGSLNDGCFPILIDPWQPFTDIRTLTHRQGGLTVSCQLTGDSFEMEDQRNWSDASFKTYVRPLAKPWPYVVPAGTRDRQTVRLEIAGDAKRSDASASDTIVIEMGEPVGTMPRIGLVITPEHAGTMQRADLDHAGVQDLLLSFEARAGHGLAEMRTLALAVEGTPQRKTLECVIAATGDLDAELGAVAEWVADVGLKLDAIAVYPAPDLQSTPPGSVWPDCPPLAEIYAAARRAFPGLPLGGGMYSYFTELNRKRPPVDQLDFVTHATCPIVHAADDLSVMQSLDAVPHILRSARAIIGDRPYRLGPVTIGMRHNPYGSRTMPNASRDRIPMALADPRQDGRFAAAWTIGYAAMTEEAALDTVILGALTGPLGLIGDEGARPVFATVAALAELAGQARLACRSSSPGKAVALATGGIAIVANLTAETQRVRLASEAITLGPFEIARVSF
ncbi:MAG: hypothetical protein V4530_05640 [Pseudomonadota bacterium]